MSDTKPNSAEMRHIREGTDKGKVKGTGVRNSRD
jgi:hypothetical protein